MNHSEEGSNLVDAFDRIRGGMEGRPDVTMTRLSSLQSVDPLVGNVSTFMVQTVRERERGDTIFLQVATKDGNIRIVLPPKVAKVIARQCDTLTSRVRSKLAKEEAQKRKDAGIAPFGGKRYVR